MYGQPGGRPQDFERVARTVHVGGIGGLGETITETDVADFFGQQGEVTAVRISGRFCWVEFADVRAAHAALELDGNVTGGHHLRVSQSKSAIHSNGLKKRTDGAPGMDGGAAMMGAYGAAQHAMPHAMPGPYGMPGTTAPYGAQPPYGYPQYGAPPPYGYSAAGAYGAPPPQQPQYPPHGQYGAPPPHYGYPPQTGGYGAPSPQGPHYPYAPPPPPGQPPR